MNEALIARVEAYLAGEMTAEERTAFEAEMQQDEALRAEVLPMLAGEAALALSARETKHAEMRAWYQEARQATPIPSRSAIRPLWIGLAVAAAVAILILVFWPSKTLVPQIDQEALFAEYYEPITPPEFRGSPTGLDSAIMLAHAQILSEDYPQAITRLEAILQANNLTDQQVREERTYLASCYLSTQQGAKALAALNTLMPDQTGEVRWLRAMSHLQLGQWGEAQKVLQSLAEDEVPYYGAKAQTILSKLDVSSTPN